MISFTRKIPLLAFVCILVLMMAGCSSKSFKNEPVSQLNGVDDLDLQKKLAKKSRRRKDWLEGDDKYSSLWDRLFDLYGLPQVENKVIDREISWFANHLSYLDRAQTRAEPFLYSIVRHIEKQKVPGELALLPIVESAFQPHAISPANAAGIWQFIPETGKRFGLKKNHSYDGRRDVYASTRAAIKYLKRLHDKFGDWLLAIAAYNCGEGAVAKAIQKNVSRHKPTDFWSLDLPEETRAYVPRLIAVSRVFAENEKYGVLLRHMPNEALFKAVKMTQPLDLALAADAADISMEKLFELNPGFRHRNADVPGSYRIYIPADKTRTFRKELNRLAMEKQFESQQSGRGGDAEDALVDDSDLKSSDMNPYYTNEPGFIAKRLKKHDANEKIAPLAFNAGRKSAQSELTARDRQQAAPVKAGTLLKAPGQWKKGGSEKNQESAVAEPDKRPKSPAGHAEIRKKETGKRLDSKSVKPVGQPVHKSVAPSKAPASAKKNGH